MAHIMVSGPPGVEDTPSTAVASGTTVLQRRLTLAPARPTTGIHRLLFLVCTALYYGFARYLPFWPRLTPSELVASVPRVPSYAPDCGSNVNVEHGAYINSGKEIDVGNNSGIGLNAYILGPLIVGSNVMMGPGCTLLGTNHNFQRTDVPMITQGNRPSAPPIIEDDVWLGANVTVLPGRRIGTGSVIGAGAIVTHDIPPFAVASGNPAKVVRYRG